ncbi:S24 family peptidase [Ahrensia marina]|uniref:S24 family peptidase n=1 Tax=Ahrensia marina TaxID=1514904 RepID=UPI0035D0823C
MINQNTLTSNENGNRPISRKMAEVYAQVFNVSAGWLLYGEEANSSRMAIPLVSWVSAGALTETNTVLHDEDAIRFEYTSELDPAGDWIALRVQGRSMDKISPEDSIIFVNRKEKMLVPNGCYIISDGDGGATYKRYRPPNKFEPVSTKPEEFDTLTFDQGQEPEIIGRVRKTVLSL